MITETKYVCEGCLRSYLDKEHALACEQHHKTKINKCVVFDYAIDSIDSEGYPKVVKVTFDNGRTRLYGSKYFQGVTNED